MNTIEVKIEEPKGWICPKCGAAVNPSCLTCPNCSAQPVVPALPYVPPAGPPWYVPPTLPWPWGWPYITCKVGP